MLRLVHTYQSKTFDPNELHVLKKTFAESYQASIKSHGPRTFLKVYEGSSVIEKSFDQFHHDVQLAKAAIEAKRTSETILVTLGTNTYRHCVYIVAGLLSGMSLCPMNGDEETKSVDKKLASLGGRYLTWHEKDMHFSGTPKDIKTSVSFPSDQPFIMIFTSGSTGYSKVVEQMEFNVLSNIDALIEHHSLSKEKVVGTSLPLFHVNTLEFSFFSCLMSGSKLVLFQKFNIATVAQAIFSDQIEILSLIPTLIRWMVERPNDFIDLTKPTSLKYVVSAAAPLSKTMSLAFMKAYQCPILQGYGLSEAVNFSATLPSGLSMSDYAYWLGHFPQPSIGPALRGNEIHILNSEGKPCRAGEVGEVCIRGWNVMRKYLDADADSLFADGFLHTGDLGYFHPDSTGKPYYFISGRSKDVIKRHGETVSLREVDDLIVPLLPSGSDAIAVGFNNTIAGEELGLIVTGLTEHQTKDLLVALQDVPRLQRPGLALLSEQTLRTPSGKPQRWKFLDSFLPFKDTFFGTKVKIEKEDA